MLPSNLPNMGGAVWGRIVPASARPWVLTGRDGVATAASVSGSVPVGMVGVITRICGVVGYSQSAGVAKIENLDWTLTTVTVVVAGQPWTLNGTAVVPAPLNYLANLPAVTIQGAFSWDLPLPEPIVLRQQETIEVSTGGTWPHDCTIMSLWAVGYLGTPGAAQ